MGRQLRLVGACGWCEGPLLASRVDARYCSRSCRQAAHRTKIRRADLSATDRPLRLAYADPPYPGKSRLYRAEASYGGEVDHGELLSRLEAYDGWALSTSAAALPDMLALCVARALQVRVGAWFRRARPHATAAILNAWEPVVFAGGRHVAASSRRQVTDTLVGVTPRRRSTRPGAVVGAKPAEFCWWLFYLLGAAVGDTFEDLYPGSGMVAWCWREFVRPGASFPGGGQPQQEAVAAIEARR